MLIISLYFALVCLVLAMLLAMLRLILGPSAHDRILALDSLWLLSLLFILLLAIKFTSLLYFEIALVIALTGFISTFAVAKFLMRGEIIE